MKYKGYTGVVEFDEDSGTLFGHVIGLRDGITFQGDSVAEVVQAFHDSVDDYLEFCAEARRKPGEALLWAVCLAHRPAAPSHHVPCRRGARRKPQFLDRGTAQRGIWLCGIDWFRPWEGASKSEGCRASARPDCHHTAGRSTGSRSKKARAEAGGVIPEKPESKELEGLGSRQRGEDLRIRADPYPIHSRRLKEPIMNMPTNAGGGESRSHKAVLIFELASIVNALRLTAP